MFVGIVVLITYIHIEIVSWLSM